VSSSRSRPFSPGMWRRPFRAGAGPVPRGQLHGPRPRCQHLLRSMHGGRRLPDPVQRRRSGLLSTRLPLRPAELRPPGSGRRGRPARRRRAMPACAQASTTKRAATGRAPCSVLHQAPVVVRLDVMHRGRAPGIRRREPADASMRVLLALWASPFKVTSSAIPRASEQS
jgi:hypothetical protein